MTDLSTLPEFSLEPSEHLRKRNRAERRFQRYGFAAIMIALAFLAVMLFTIFKGGIGVLTTTEIGLDVTYSEDMIDPQGKRDVETLRGANYKPLLTQALAQTFPEVTERRPKQNLYRLLSNGAVYQLQDAVTDNTNLIGTTQRVWVPSSGDVNLYATGKVDPDLDATLKRLSPEQTTWVMQLKEKVQYAKVLIGGFSKMAIPASQN